MDKGNIFTNAITAAVLGVITFYVSRWALPDSLATVKDSVMLIAPPIAGAIGVWLGNIVWRAIKSSTPS